MNLVDTFGVSVRSATAKVESNALSRDAESGSFLLEDTLSELSDEVGRTGIKAVYPDASDESLRYAAELNASAARRTSIPVRQVFVRDFKNTDPDAAAGSTPLSRLIATGGRGGGVAVKLYLALIWRCSKPPFETNISARKWAGLLSLDDAPRRGARRIADALHTLEEAKLITLTANRGEPSTISLREEGGSGAEYTLPSTAYIRLEKKNRGLSKNYFKVPTQLWTQGHFQSMSAPATAMLLVGLASSSAAPERPFWWSTRTFPQQYALSPATRARGTRELVARRLMLVQKQLVTDAPGQREFTRERVRNLYQLINESVLSLDEPAG